MKALVTAGGTREWLDDIRFISNLSSGSFGVAIAEELQRRGVETTLLGSPLALKKLPPDSPLILEPFDTFKQLQDQLARLTRDFQPDIIFMAAAVSDYSPIKQKGKIKSSDSDTLVITLHKNPKLLSSLRTQAERAFIVGFKLLSGVSEEELVRVAHKQTLRANIDMTFANDIKAIKKPRHPGIMVMANGETTSVDGTKIEVAEKLVDFVLKTV